MAVSAATTFNNITVAASAIVTTSSNSTINTAFTINSLGSFSASGGTITMATTGWTISNSGNLAFNGLTISETPSSQSSASYTINGALTVNSDKTLAPTGGTTTMAGSGLSGWGYKKSITLSRASGAVTDYQMKLLVGEFGAVGEDVDCNSHCQTDFDDIRFTTSDGTTLLDYWIESITGITPNQLATIWIEFDSIGTGATTFYMYYGNASATSVSNGDNTFLFFDDFLGTSLDGSKWTSSGTVSVSGGEAVIGSTSNTGYIYSSYTSSEAIMRTNVKWTSRDATYVWWGWIAAGGSSQPYAIFDSAGTSSQYGYFNDGQILITLPQSVWMTIITSMILNGILQVLSFSLTIFPRVSQDTITPLANLLISEIIVRKEQFM